MDGQGPAGRTTREVTNPGFSGAMILLSFPVFLFGGMAVLTAAFNIWTRQSVGEWWAQALVGPALIVWGMRLVRRARQARLTAAGACRKCGYDLSDRPNGTVCPECGDLEEV